MDLRDWMRPDRVVALLDLIEQCPSACRWREAAENDVEWVRWQNEAAQDRPQLSRKWAPRISEYDLHASLLAQLIDTVGVIAEGLKIIKKYQPLPGPRTAQAVAEAEQSLDMAVFLIKQLTPHALDEGR